MWKKQGYTKKRDLLLRVAALLLSMTLLFTGCAAGQTGKPIAEATAESVDGTPETASLSANQPERAAETPILTTEQPEREAETPMGEAGTWTIFLYMCGSNLESESAMASINLLQIMNAVPGDKVNIIVQTGGAKAWGIEGTDDEEFAKTMQALGIDNVDSSLIDISAETLQRYRVTDHMELLEELPLASMGAEDTFYDFLKWGVENYPAEHMGVLMWDHGGAGTYGVCSDELFDEDSLLPFEMNEAFQRLFPEMTDRFEFIGFDACLMSTVEVANAISPFARYMYASEETIPGYGWAYSNIIHALNADPAMDGEALGKTVCDCYRSLYSKVDELTGGTSVDTCTLSVTDLEKVNDIIDTLDALGDRLVTALDKPEELKQVTQAALLAESFTYPYMLDMGSLAETLESIYPEEAKALQDTLRKAIVYSTHGSFSADSTGMAIFYPRSSVRFNFMEGTHTGLIARYALCAPSKSYYEFVKELQFIQYRARLSGVPSVRVLDEPHLEEVDEENVAYAMTLNPEELDKVAEMYYQIWMLMEAEEDGEKVKTAILLGNRMGVQLDETTGEVTNDFDDSWKWVMLNGVPLEMNIQSYNENEIIYRAPILLNDDHTNLIIRWVKATDSYELVGTYTGFDSETNELSRMVYPLRDGDIIGPRYEYARVEPIQSGAMEYSALGSEMTTYVDTVPEHRITYNQDNTRLEYKPLDDGDYYFQYYLTDIYGSKQAFAPLEFTMQNKEAYVEMEEEEPTAAEEAADAA